MKNKIFKSIELFLKNFAYCILGTAVIGGLVIYSIFSLPVYLYRWIVCKVLAPICRRDKGKAITVGSSIFATEFSHDGSCIHPRCALVVTTTIEGTVTLEELEGVIHPRWITAENSAGGGLIYPELQQYVERWMGYMFWKQDKAFCLQNHLVQHKCLELWSEAECERFVCSITEDLLNKPFPKEKSPWEAHVINGYRNSEMSSDGKEMTVKIFRFHHCLADGYGVLSVFCEGLLGKPLSKCEIATPAKARGGGVRSAGRSCPSRFAKIINFASFPIRIMRDGGLTVTKFLNFTRTPWHIPEEKQTHQLLYTRSKPVPISKIKFVKDRLEASFTAVLLSSISAGIANSFKGKGLVNPIRKLQFGSPLPLKDHPDKLRNHSTVAFYDLPVDQTLSPLQRLRKSEKALQIAKHSTLPILGSFFVKLFASQINSVSNFLFTNRTIATGLTNFPGPGVKLSAHGWNVVSTDFAVGIQLGVAGVGFMVLSYCDHIRIVIVAEKAAVDRRELENLMTAIRNEIKTLHDLAMTENNARDLISLVDHAV